MSSILKENVKVILSKKKEISMHGSVKLSGYNGISSHKQYVHDKFSGLKDFNEQLHFIPSSQVEILLS